MKDKTPKTVTYKGTKYKVRYATGAGADGKPCFVCATDKLFGPYGDELPIEEFMAATGVRLKATDRDVSGPPTGKGV
jgi:hypothetical protein